MDSIPTQIYIPNGRSLVALCVRPPFIENSGHGGGIHICGQMGNTIIDTKELQIIPHFIVSSFLYPSPSTPSSKLEIIKPRDMALLSWH